MGHTADCDLEGLSEKYWGEILERTVSSSSLPGPHQNQSGTKLDCNGGIEMNVLNNSLSDLWKLDKTTQTFDLGGESMGSSAETAIVTK